MFNKINHKICQSKRGRDKLRFLHNKNVSAINDKEFVPETSKETTSLLNKALNWKEKPDKEAEFTLTENVFIPSHEEIENDSLANLHEFEQGLQCSCLHL